MTEPGNPTAISQSSGSVAPKGCPLQPPRRSFLKKLLAICIAGATATVPIVLAIGYAFTPFLKRKQSSDAGDGFRFVGKVGGLQAGGAPQMFQVIGVKKDAWTTYPATPLGSVFVRLGENGELQCLNARCTHLGCTVGYQSTQKSYFCPCHTASFTLDGGRTNEVPPRDMDRLEAEIRNGEEIWVKYQDFRGGTVEKIPV